MRKTAAFAAVAAILALSVGFASPAEALSLPPGAPATPADLQVDLPSSVLAGSDPTQTAYDARFAQIANDYHYTADPASRVAPAPPATSAAKLAKAGGGALTAIFGLNIVGRLETSAISTVFGYDANGAVCKGVQGNAFVTELFGYDCSQTAAPAGGFVANTDQTTTWSTTTGLTFTPTTSSTYTSSNLYGQSVNLKYVGMVAENSSGSPNYYDACYKMTVNGTAVHSFDSSSTGEIVQPVTEVLSNGVSRSTITVKEVWNRPNPQSAFDRGVNACVAAGGDAIDTSEYASSSPVQLTQYGFGSASLSMQSTTPNPDRTLECVVTMTDGTTVSSVGPVFHETDKSFPAPQCPQVPAGKVPNKVDWNERTNGANPTNVGTAPTTQAYKDWLTKYPECGDGSCSLDLAPVPAAGSPVTSCFADASSCADWFQDPNKATDYQCTYGTHSVDIAECNLYANLFKPNALQNGVAYSDPSTGAQLPNGSKSTIPQDQTAYDAMVQPPTAARQCFPTGYDAFNPVQWVMMPVQCALEWAFVPDPAKVNADGQKVSDTWKAAAPGKLLGTLAAWGSMMPSMSGCQGPPVPFHWDGIGDNYYPLSACPGTPLENVAPVARTFGAAALYLGAGLAVTKYIAAAFGYRGAGGAGGGEG